LKFNFITFLGVGTPQHGLESGIDVYLKDLRFGLAEARFVVACLMEALNHHKACHIKRKKLARFRQCTMHDAFQLT
jgi:hypothetical protein